MKTISKVFLPAVALVIFCATTYTHAATQEVDLITNGGFESGTTGWTLSGAVVTSGGNQYNGTQYAVLGEIDGATDLLSQAMTVPAGAGMSTASFYYYIYTEEPLTTAYDVLDVTLEDLTSGTSHTIANLSNKDGGTCTAGRSCYKLASKQIDLGSKVGHSIQYRFRSKLDADTLTSFKIDDVKLLVQVTTAEPLVAPSKTTATTLSASSIVLVWQDNSGAESGFYVERKTGSGSYSRIKAIPAMSGTGQGVQTEDGGLQPNTPYCYRVQTYDSLTTSTFSNESCATTLQSAQSVPTVVTGSATNITPTGARLNGTVNPNGVASGGFFQWGLTTSFGNVTSSDSSPGASTSPMPISAILSGLSPATTYYYRIVGANGQVGSQVFGETKNFNTAQGTVTTACSDGIDNDGDGLIDYPNDVGCTDVSDGDETNVSSGTIDIEVSDSPDPFTPSLGETVTIKVRNLSDECHLRVTIDATGREWIENNLQTSVDINWDGHNDADAIVPAGTYQYTAECVQARNNPPLTMLERVREFFIATAYAFFSDVETGSITVLGAGGANHPPVLTFPPDSYSDGVEPNSGGLDTVFTFHVVYADEDNDTPEDVTLHYRGENWADWSFKTMATTSGSGDWYDGDFRNGELYVTDGKFDQVKKYEYYFTTDDGTNSGIAGQDRLPEGEDVKTFFVGTQNQCNDGVDNDGDNLQDDLDDACAKGKYLFEAADQLERFMKQTKISLQANVGATTPKLVDGVNYFGQALNGDVVDFFVSVIIETISGIADIAKPAQDRIDSVADEVLKLREQDVLDLETLATNKDLDFTVEELEHIVKTYQIGVQTRIARVQVIFFTEWLIKEATNLVSNVAGLETLNSWLGNLKTLLVSELPPTTVADVNAKIEQQSSMLDNSFASTVVSPMAMSLAPDVYNRLHFASRLGAMEAMGGYYSNAALMLSTFADMKDDWAFKSSTLAYGIGMSAGGAAALYGSTMIGCTGCVTALSATFLGDLASIASSAMRNSELYVWGSDILEQSGLYASDNAFSGDILGAISVDADSILQGLTKGKSEWLTPTGVLVSHEKIDDHHFSVSIKNTSTTDDREYKLVVNSFVSKTAHSLFNGLMTWNYDLPFMTLSPGGREWSLVTHGATSRLNFDVLHAGYGTTTVKLLERTKDGIFLVDSISIPADDTKKGWFNNMFAGKIMSPGELRAYDNEGRVTGLVDGRVVEEIPSSFYDETNHAFVIFDPHNTYSYEVEGTGVGTYGLEFAAIVNGDKSTLSWAKVPITHGETHTWVTDWDTVDNNKPSVTLGIDKDGDGTPEQTVNIGTSYSDTLAPTTIPTLTGALTTSDTYLGTTTVSLVAEDNEGGVGVEKTEYSFDGETWHEYTAPVEVADEGTHTISYRSTDWFGNVEDTKSVTFTIIVDNTPPTTTLTTTGTGGPTWFRSNVGVILAATDNEGGTGVASTTYSLDDGTTWQDYSAPFTLTGEGKHTVLYRSTDKAGNVEDTKTATLYIDLTAPEARVSANILSKDLLVAGKDNMGSTTVAKTTTGYTITDEAGHTTKLTFKKTWGGKVLTFAQLTGIQYDSAPAVTLPKTQLLYVWTPPTGTSNLTNQTVHVNKTFTVNATYLKPLNRTIVTVSQNGKAGTKQTFPGLKLVTLTTEKGVVGYEL